MSRYVKVLTAALGMLLVVASVQAGTVTTDADTYVDSTTNHGTAATILVKRSSAGAGSSYTRTGWVHFDLATLPPATQAILTFTVDNANVSSGTVTVWGINDGRTGDVLGTDWTETELTSANTPYSPDFSEGEDMTILGTFSWSSTPAADDVFVVETEALADFINADTNGEITLLLTRNMNDANFALKSRETGSGPMLEVNYIPKAWQPSPLDTEIGVSVTDPLVMTWNTGLDPNDPLSPHPEITHHQFYITPPALNGAEPNLVGVSPVEYAVDGSGGGSHTIAADTLSRDATYAWRVDEKMSDGSITTGDVWAFETALSVPIIDVQPVVDTLAEMGTLVELTVSATNPLDSTDLIYKWYRNDGLVQESTSPTYTIASAQIADEGKYHCVVTIATNGATTESAPGWLNVKRCVQHYTFDDVLTDSEGDNDGTYVNADPNITTPTFDASIAGYGNAISLDGTDYVNIGLDGHPRLHASLEHGAASCWVKTTDTDSNIMGAYNNQPQTYTTGFQYHVKGGKIRGYLRDEDATSIERNTGVVNDGEWHFVVLTWEASPAGASMSIYVDGQSQGTTTTGSVYQPFGAWQFDMLVGASNGRGTPSGLLTGLIDELKVYNHPFDAEGVAALYYEYTGKKICLYPPELDKTGPDGVPDCEINLYDFVSFASAWLESGLRPE